MADSKSPYILALDVGTSSTRAILYDATGTAVPQATSQQKYDLTTANQGEVSVDADKLLDFVVQTINDVLKAAGPLASQIVAVAADTFWHSLLGVDAQNRPLTPVITWEDTRSQQAALALRKELDEQATHDRVGVRFHASFWPAKLRWLSQSDPDTFAHVSQWISFGEYMHRKFLGHSICSLSMASATGLLNTRAGVWDEQLMHVLDLRSDQLPELGDIHQSIQGLSSEYSSLWPQLQSARWFPVIGDGAAACVGSGCMTDSFWSLTMGTSSAMRVVVEPGSVTPPLALWMYLIDARHAILGGALSEGGNLIAWLQHALQLDSDFSKSESAAADLPPDSHGLTILPLLSGERSPGWHANVRMTIAGLSIRTSPNDILRASEESLAYQLDAVYKQICSVIHKDPQQYKVMASGGALFHSHLLCQIISDTLGVPIYPSREQEASARGVALLALNQLGLLPDLAGLQPDLLTPVQPDSQHHIIYQQAAQRQDDLYQRLLGDQ
jgi:gluconokinase